MLNLDKSKKYLLACSFGPDSMALFDMLIKEGYIFEVAHVNYHLRKEAESETEQLLAYCKNNNIECHVLSYYQWTNKSNLEAKCREIRYKFFADLYKAGNFEAVLVAHNQDDLIETYLLQKRRKTLVTFYGLQERSVINNTPICRPLLKYTKQELLDYCVNNHIPYCIDSSNLLDCYQRNIIRHKIVSNLNSEERFNYSLLINKENDVLSKLFADINSCNLNSVFEIIKFDNDDFCYALNELCHKCFPNYSLSKKMCKEVKDVLISEKSNVEIKIKRNLYFIKTYDQCYFEEKKDLNYLYFVEKPIEINNEYFYANLLSDTSNLHVTDKDYPLTIRNIKKTDSYLVSGYQKKVNRLLIDWKMPLNLRKKWPCILNREGNIVFIPRYRADFKPFPGLNFFVK